MTHGGDLGSNPGLPQLWRLVTLKPLKLQQCTLHFWKPLIFFYLGKRGQGQSYVLNTQKAFVKIPGFTIVSLLAGYISMWLSVTNTLKNQSGKFYKHQQTYLTRSTNAPESLQTYLKPNKPQFYFWESYDGPPCTGIRTS